MPTGFTIVMLLTVFLILFVDLMAGLVIGFIIAAFVNSRDVEAFEVRRLISVPLLDREILGAQSDWADPFEARSGLVRFPERVSVASAREIVRIVGRDVDGQQILVFDLSRTEYIDDTAAVALGRLVDAAIARGTRKFVIAGLHEDVAEKLNALQLLDRVPEENFAANLDEAKEIIRPILEAELKNEPAAETRESMDR